MEVKRAIETRRSVRRYVKKAVSEEVINEIVDAARLAPSGCNAQPCRFYIINSEKIVEKLRERKAFRQDFVYSAPAIIVCCGDSHAYSGKLGGEYQVKEGSVPKDEKKRKELFSVLEGKEVLRVVRDVSIASAFMVLRATELGLGTSFIGLIDELVLREVLGIPDDFVIPFVLIAGYYEGDIPARPRKTLEEIIKQGG